MGSDCGPDRTDRKLLRVILPEHLAVLDVFLEKGIVDSCITKPEGQGKIDAAGILNLFYQEIDLFKRISFTRSTGARPVRLFSFLKNAERLNPIPD